MAYIFFVNLFGIYMYVFNERELSAAYIVYAPSIGTKEIFIYIFHIFYL